jgi:hypothetical protein
VEAGKQARRTWTNRLTTACSGLSLRGDGPLVVIGELVRYRGVFSEPVGVFSVPCLRRGSTFGDVPGGHFVIGPV